MNEDGNTPIPIVESVQICIDYFKKFNKCIVTGETASNMLHVLSSLFELSGENEEFREILERCSHNFVRHDWQDRNRLKVIKFK